MSLNAPIKEIADKFQLTNTHTPGEELPWVVPNPSHWGAVIAAPLQTAASSLGAEHP